MTGSRTCMQVSAVALAVALGMSLFPGCNRSDQTIRITIRNTGDKTLSDIRLVTWPDVSDPAEDAQQEHVIERLDPGCEASIRWEGKPLNLKLLSFGLDGATIQGRGAWTTWDSELVITLGPGGAVDGSGPHTKPFSGGAPVTP